MKEKLKSLRIRMLLPVIAMSLFVVILLTTLFSLSYTDMVLQQEREINAVGFDTISRSITPLIKSSVDEIQSVMSDEPVANYARLQFNSLPEMVHARIRCRDYLQDEITWQDEIYGLLFMRKDGSIFGVLPEGNFFLDDPEDNPLPDEIRNQILSVPLGETIWIGSLSGSDLYGFENENTPRSIMIGAWKSVDLEYGECYALMLMDDSVFDKLFKSLEDGKSSWRLFTADKVEFYHSGEITAPIPDELIDKSSNGTIFRDENNHSVCAFSTTMSSPSWTLVREVSLEENDRLIYRIRSTIGIFALLIFLITLAAYQLWLKKFMKQFNMLLKGIIRMGEGDLEPLSQSSFSIGEFERMQREIDRTSLALHDQMNTIRKMERAQAEQERIAEELHMARQIQHNALPHTFPPFPERKEIDLFASMDPARDVGGDFYNYFFIDTNHLCLVIADVSGKGIPAALFMMFSKRVIEDSAESEYSAGRILEKTNDMLCSSDSQTDMFVTVWIGILDLSTGVMTAANAGHEYPVIRKSGGCFELYKDKHNFVIGGMENIRYKEYTLALNPGDKLFVYTDGVPEATNGSNEMFGTDRMVETLNGCGNGSPREILQSVKQTVDAFVGDAEQFDDLTMMCLEYIGKK